MCQQYFRYCNWLSMACFLAAQVMSAKSHNTKIGGSRWVLLSATQSNEVAIRKSARQNLRVQGTTCSYPGLLIRINPGVDVVLNVLC